MNQNAELVKRLEKHASFCEKDGQRIVARNLREAALTISTQERVIVELREALREAMEANYHRLEPHERPLADDPDWIIKARALSKGSGQ